MTTKRKISVRKILQAVVTLVLTSGCVIAVLSASKIQESEELKGVFIQVKNEKQYQFLDKKTLLNNIVEANHLEINRTKLGSINIKLIERQVYQSPWVAKAQVYIDNQRNLHIYATQHSPAARIFFENGQTCYINKELKLLPTSDKFTYYTTVVTNVPWYNNDSMNNAARAKVVSLISVVEHDTFWNAQIEQIAMTPDMEFEIYPVLGTHKILFGDTTLAKRKFENLFGFYKNVLDKIGWDKYEVLDARFNDQIVASPALAWKMPAKGFISNMDWVKTIMGAEDNRTPPNAQLISNIASANNAATNSVPATTASPKSVTTKPLTNTTTTSSISKPAASKVVLPNTNSKPSVNSSAQSKPKTQAETKTKPATIKNPENPKNTNTKKDEQAKPKYILN